MRPFLVATIQQGPLFLAQVDFRENALSSLLGLCGTLALRKAGLGRHLETQLRVLCAGTFDEESERKLWTLMVRHACLKCVDQLGYLAQEQEILAGMLQRLNDDPGEAALQAQGAHCHTVPDARAR